MKKNAYENSKLKHQLLSRKRKGVKQVVWKLKPSQKEFVEESLGFYTEAYLYEVRTKRFYNISSLDSLLKQIHFCNKQGKNKVVFKLDRKQKKLLDNYEVSYSPYKYRIKLSS